MKKYALCLSATLLIAIIYTTDSLASTVKQLDTTQRHRAATLAAATVLPATAVTHQEAAVVAILVAVAEAAVKW